MRSFTPWCFLVCTRLCLPGLLFHPSTPASPLPHSLPPPPPPPPPDTPQTSTTSRALQPAHNCCPCHRVTASCTCCTLCTRHDCSQRQTRVLCCQRCSSSGRVASVTQSTWPRSREPPVQHDGTWSTKRVDNRSVLGFAPALRSKSVQTLQWKVPRHLLKA